MHVLKMFKVLGHLLYEYGKLMRHIRQNNNSTAQSIFLEFQSDLEMAKLLEVGKLAVCSK